MRRRGKPLKSGILNKPDECGIKKVVSYAHEKLSQVHVKSRFFSELPFHFLVAGEIELILDDSTKVDEKIARLNILKTLAYHKQYVEVEDLKDQYDVTLKEIEHDAADWADVNKLVNDLHTNLTFRATVRARERDEATVAKLEKLADKKAQSAEFKNKNGELKVFYCSDFNKGSCPFQDHHEGQFNKKPVFKWHICWTCFTKDGKTKRFHREGDTDCPNVSA